MAQRRFPPPPSRPTPYPTHTTTAASALQSVSSLQPVPPSPAAADAASLPLQSLPLRPSSLSLLLRHGFATTSDVLSSKSGSSGGISNFAAELGGIGLVEAAGIGREVEGALRGVLTGGDGNGEGGGGGPDLVPPQGGAADGSIGSASAANDASARHAALAQPSSAPPPPPPPPPSSGPTKFSIGATAASLLLAPAPSSNGTTNAQPSQRHVVTFCRSIDSLLGGGFALSELTEVSGPPGVGKTQLSMQLCVDARLPRQYGGVEGEAVYIDSEGSFSPERCWDMAESLVGHVRQSSERRRRRQQQNKGQQQQPDVPDWFNPTEILSGIHVYRVHDLTSQTATVKSLPAFLQERKSAGTPVRVVVIDSVAFHYRVAPRQSEGGDYRGRTRSLTQLAGMLSDVAREFDVAVVAVNQMTTRVGNDGIDSSGADDYGESRLIPALGESWSHSTTTRLLLTHGGGRSMMGGTSGSGSGMDGNGVVRRCRLVKSPHKAAGTALYQVLGTGIRDAPQVTTTAARGNGAMATTGMGGGIEGKRQRVQ